MYRLTLLILFSCVASAGSAQHTIEAFPDPFNGTTDATLVLRNVGTEPTTLDSLRFASSLDTENEWSHGSGWALYYTAYVDDESWRGSLVCDPVPDWPCDDQFGLFDRTLTPADSVVFDTFLLYCAFCRGRARYSAPIGVNDTLFVYGGGGPEPREVVFRDAGVVLPSEGGPAAVLRLDVYPNPTTGDASARFDLPVSGEVEVRVLDTTGRVLSSTRRISAAGEVRVPLGLGALAAGLYHVEVRAEPPTGPPVLRSGPVVVLD